MEKKQKRNLIDVLEAVLNVIPDKTLRWKCIAALRSVKESYSFHPPELQASDWRDAAEILVEICGPSRGEPWEETVRKVFSGEEDYNKYLP